MTSKSAILAAIALAYLALLATPPAQAQTQPTAAEVAAFTGLHAAAARGDLAEIRRLLTTGAPINARDARGRTALHIAAFQAQPEAAKALIAAGIDHALLDSERYDAVTIVAVRDDLPTLTALLSSGASAKLTTSIYDGTALIAAAHLGHDGVVQALIDAGAPLDHVNNLAWTALIEAVILGNGGKRHQNCVASLLSAGADRRIADRGGVTPEDHARRRNYTEILALFAAIPPKTR